MLRILSTIAFVSLISYTPSAKAEFRPMIVGGEEAVKGEFPFIVSLQGSWGHFCGGSIVKPGWVLTAAHCVSGGAPRKILAGLHDRTQASDAEVLTASQVFIHPKNDPDKMDYDFALIRLNQDSRYAPIPINHAELRGEVNMVTAGWGTTQEGGGGSLPAKLQKVTVPLVSAEECSKSYPGEITNSMICAGLENGGKDSCQGDSGGPLFVTNNGVRELAGVVSWGEGCARPKKYGVYSKVSEVTDWIESTTK